MTARLIARALTALLALGNVVGGLLAELVHVSQHMLRLAFRGAA